MHTPGPWHIGIEQDHSADRWKRNAEWSRIRSQENGLIAIIESIHPKGKRQSKDFDIEAANARLIAAAPTMLTALENCANIISLALANGAWGHDSTDEADSIDEVLSVLNEARAAIAKATGKEGLE